MFRDHGNGREAGIEKLITVRSTANIFVDVWRFDNYFQIRGGVVGVLYTAFNINEI